MMNELEIKSDGIDATVLLHGQEVKVKGVRIDWKAGSVPEITITGDLRHLKQVIKGVPATQLKFIVWCRNPVTLTRHNLPVEDGEPDRKEEPTCLCFSSPVADCPVEEHAIRAGGDPRFHR